MNTEIAKTALEIITMVIIIIAFIPLVIREWPSMLKSRKRRRVAYEIDIIDRLEKLENEVWAISIKLDSILKKLKKQKK